MDARVERLLSAFENNGWKVIGPADISTDWWFEDIFQLTSVWSPVGVNIYLTLLTDPTILKRKEVWAIGVSSEIPGDRHHQSLDQITLNDIKRTDLEVFVKRINQTVLNNK